MVKAEKINEDVFLISWNTRNSWRHGPSEIKIEIPDISMSFQFTHKADPSRNTRSILEMKIIPFSPVITNYKNGKVLKPSVSAIKNGVKHSMHWQNSKWTTTFSEPCACGQPFVSSSLDLTFHILIDFKFTSMKTETKHVMDHLLNLWETKTLSDVTFQFKEKTIEAHTIIIASGSPVFEAMFQSNFKEKQEKVVVIEDFSASVFEKMLHFFYTGDVDLDTVDATDLLILANKYQVNSLKEKCAIFVAENLTIDNVINYLVMSHLHESPTLYKLALKFMWQNSRAIVSTREGDLMDLMKTYPQLCLAAWQNMVLDKDTKESRTENADQNEEYYLVEEEFDEMNEEDP